MENKYFLSQKKFSFFQAKFHFFLEKIFLFSYNKKNRPRSRVSNGNCQKYGGQGQRYGIIIAKFSKYMAFFRSKICSFETDKKVFDDVPQEDFFFDF